MSELDAYHYGFDFTGVAEIDSILSAVARAGDAYHHTQHWTDEGDDGDCPVDWIQNSANEAAAAFTTLREALKETEGE